jgi:hypothetical protein
MATLGTFTAGQVLTAAELNAIGTWTAFTPSFTNFTLGDGTVDEAQYAQINNIVLVNVQVTMGTTSVMGTNPSFTSPVTIGTSESRLTVGTGRARVGASFYWIYPYVINEEITLYCVDAASAYARRANITSAIPASWGSGSDFQINATYAIA